MLRACLATDESPQSPVLFSHFGPTHSCLALLLLLLPPPTQAAELHRFVAGKSNSSWKISDLYNEAPRQQTEKNKSPLIEAATLCFLLFFSSLRCNIYIPGRDERRALIRGLTKPMEKENERRKR